MPPPSCLPPIAPCYEPPRIVHDSFPERREIVREVPYEVVHEVTKEVPIEVLREVDMHRSHGYGSRDYNQEIEDRKAERHREAGRAKGGRREPDRPLDYGDGPVMVGAARGAARPMPGAARGGNHGRDDYNRGRRY